MAIGRKKRKQPPPELTHFYWRVYAGASLRDANADPIEIIFDRDTHVRLHRFDSCAWRGLLSLIAIEGRERH